MLESSKNRINKITKNINRKTNNPLVSLKYNVTNHIAYSY